MSYEEFRKRATHLVEERLEWKDLATYVPNKKLPVYNWFYYKEGFARELVVELIRMLSLKEGDAVLDPFCGSGTTLLACKENGIKSVGYDVLPLSVFVSKVKAAEYGEKTLEMLEDNLRRISRARFYPARENLPKIFRKAFNKYALQDIAFLRKEIMNLDPEAREFFVLALVNAAIKCSYAYKDGSVVKFRKKPVPPMRKFFVRTAKKMLKDARKLHGRAESTVEINDARRLPLEDESMDAVITSPPYLNNIDYTKVYAIEEFFVRGEPEPGVRAFVGLRSHETDCTFLEEIEMPLQARLYFEDMNFVLKEMYRVLKKGGRAAIVVGNGYVDDVIESDIILSYLAEKIGFSVKKIYVLNKRFALEDRTVKKGVLRESLIILEKQ